MFGVVVVSHRKTLFKNFSNNNFIMFDFGNLMKNVLFMHLDGLDDNLSDLIMKFW